MIDLHIHTKYSDGTNTPFEILQAAENLGLKQISITDHNCVDGAVEATKYLDDFCFDFIIGCELSCDYKDKEIHLLGYFDKSTKNFDALNAFIKKGDSAKQVQHKAIIEKFSVLGFDVTYDELVRLCPTSARNRVHIAQLLINKGYAQSVAEVFDIRIKARPFLAIGREQSCATIGSLKNETMAKRSLVFLCAMAQQNQRPDIAARI